MAINRKKYLVLTGIGVVTAAGVASLTSGPLMMRGAGVDLLTLMKARSPGERMAGAETSKRASLGTPIAAALPASKAPVSRVLSAAAPAAVPAVLAPAAAPPLALAAPAAVAPVAPIIAAPLAAAPIAAAGIPAGVGALGLVPLVPAALGDGGGGGGLDITQPPGTGGGVEVPPGPAVPEPATWLMMITGFGMLGMVLRRRRRLLAKSSGAGFRHGVAG